MRHTFARSEGNTFLAEELLAAEASSQSGRELPPRLQGMLPLGEAAPVILVVEDLHWADQSTLDLLTFLLHNARNERLLGVATYRSDEHGGANLRGFRAEFGRLADRIELARFGRDDLTALLAEILGGPPPTQVVDRVAASSDGNPFFAEELLAAGLDREQPPLTPRLRDVLLARVQALSEDGREMLRAAATIGRRVDHGLLAVVSELTDRALLAALREAVDHQILASDPEGLYIFRHALTREAVYESLLPGERQRLHGAVARALAEDRGVAARGAPAAAELAHHWVQAGDPPRALAATIEAARRSASGAYAFAAADRLYERALDLWALVDSDDQPSGLVLTDLLREAAEAARWVDDQERAAVLVGRALDLVDPAGDPAGAAMLMERLGLYLWEVGDGKRSLGAHEAAARLLIGQPPSVAGAQVLAAHGTALMLSSRYREARRRCEAAVAMARLVGARRAETQALNTLGFAISMLGDPEGGIARLEQSRVLAEEDGDVDAICRAETNLATVWLLVGQAEAAVRVADRGIAITRRLGVELTGGAVLLGISAVTLFRLGRWDEAEALTREVLDRRVPPGVALFAHATQVELHTGRGRLDDAAESLRAARGLANGVTDPLALGHLHAVAAELALWANDPETAGVAVAAGLQAASGSEEDHLVLRLCALGIRAEADRVEQIGSRRRAGELASIRAAASPLLDRVGALAGASGSSAGFPEAQINVRACHAERSRLDGDPDAAAWDEVAMAWTEFGFPFPAAYARWRQGEALLQVRDRPAATLAVRTAHRTATALGADLLCRSVELLADRGRLDLRDSSPVLLLTEARPVPADEYRLTARERAVLGHVAIGSTNRQIARVLFISEKIASVHVSNIIAKLGVANRGEAAALVHRLDLVELPARSR